jgi:hypothetical protein
MKVAAQVHPGQASAEFVTCCPAVRAGGDPKPREGQRSPRHGPMLTRFISLIARTILPRTYLPRTMSFNWQFRAGSDDHRIAARQRCPIPSSGEPAASVAALLAPAYIDRQVRNEALWATQRVSSIRGISGLLRT